ncbi:MAG TPA: sulfotransferase [Candidatus Didemnitutus sp.]|nr:sulfotransferase [Candidatus Didemnitutus sp.]
MKAHESPPGARSAKLPNFILAGAPKSGTTALYHYLRQHPQIYLSPIKEPTFFGADDFLTDPEIRAQVSREQDRLRAYLAQPKLHSTHFLITEWNDYVQLFREVLEEIAVGEASVSYLWLPGSAAALRARLPEARLIFILRDPTERLFSLYLLDRRRAAGTTFRDWVLKAMQQAGDSPGVRRYPIPLDGGFYATQLGRFLEFFPRHQIKIHRYEEFRADPRRVLRDLFEFLGVNSGFPVDLSRRHNETLVPRFPALAAFRKKFFGQRRLLGWLPDKPAHFVRRLLYAGKSSFEVAPEDRKLVVDYYRDEIVRTEELIGMDLSRWRR